MRRLKRENFIDRDRVIPSHKKIQIGIVFAESLHEIVRKRVVIID